MRHVGYGWHRNSCSTGSKQQGSEEQGVWAHIQQVKQPGNWWNSAAKLRLFRISLNRWLEKI
jgi:hypothetical protein